MPGLPSSHAFAPDRWKAPPVNPPRYRTLDGVELVLPVSMNRWVLVPRALVEHEPDLIWALDYDDGEPLSPPVRDELGGDPDLDFSEGSLLVPIERWNSRAMTEPALDGSVAVGASHDGSQYRDPASAVGSAFVPQLPQRRSGGLRVARAGHATAHVITSSVIAMTGALRWAVNALLLLLALSFAAAVVQWLVPLGERMSTTEIGTGVVLLLGAMLCSALSRRSGAGHGPMRSEGALALGHAAHAIFIAGATVVAFAFATYMMGFGP